jgi:hypothetical protein
MAAPLDLPPIDALSQVSDVDIIPRSMDHGPYPRRPRRPYASSLVMPARMWCREQQQRHTDEMRDAWCKEQRLCQFRSMGSGAGKRLRGSQETRDRQE